MISGVQDMLPKVHEYTEKTSISTDGLRVWEQQINRNYEVQRDKDGNIITNEVDINGDSKVNDLGIDVNVGEFESIKVNTKEDFEKVKKAVLPKLQKLGLDEKNIRWVNGTVKIDLPVLKKKSPTEPTPKVETVAKPKFTIKGEQVTPKIENSEIKPTRPKLDVILDKRQSIKDRISEKLKQQRGQVNSGFDPTLLKDFVELGATYVEEGVVKTADLVKKFREDYKAFGFDDKTITDAEIVEQVFNLKEDQQTTPSEEVVDVIATVTPPQTE